MHPMPNATYWRALLLTVVSSVCLASPTFAQFGSLKGRFSVHVNGGYQSGRDTVRRTFVYRAYGEDARFEENHQTEDEGLFDVGGSLQVWQQLRVVVSYSQLAKADATSLTGSVPHPIAGNAPREIAPQDLSLAHKERAIYVSAAWVVPILEQLDVAIFGGPSFFNLTQGIVTGVETSERDGPPWAQVVVGGVTSGEFKKNGTGIHVGADVSYMVTPTLGLGGFLRFTQGAIDVPSSGGAQPLNVGGLQTGVGIRARF